ncbi:MAG: tetratricopeptide repeat protein [Thermodesulfovibrionales bacterium]|nr:tetratricopeptide repeat protein [Thermodesulfovibrionales bacterium]
MQGSLFIVVLTVLVAYYNSFYGVFQFDDFNVIVDNQRVHSWEGFIGELPLTIRPLLKFTYTINWISGMGIFGYHLFNLSIHIINTILIFHLIRSISIKDFEEKQAVSIALLSTILFALHPIQTEAVTYISGRSSSMMTMFVLISVLSYIKGNEIVSRPLLYVVSPLSYLCAVATKEVAIFTPLVLLLYSCLYLKMQKLIKTQWVHWLIFFLIIPIMLFTKRYSEIVFSGLDKMDFFKNLDFTLRGVFYNLSKVFFVTELNIDPSPSLLYDDSTVYWFVFAIIIITTIITVKKHRWFSFSVAWFMIFLLPYFLIPRGDILNERNLYVCMPALFLGLSVIVHRVLSNLWVKRLMFACLLVALCVLTHHRNTVYYSEISLWQDTVKKSPDNTRALINLGYAYSQKGMHKEAEYWLKKATETNNHDVAFEKAKSLMN